MSGHSRELTYRNVVISAIRSGLDYEQVSIFIQNFTEIHHPLVSEHGNHPRNEKLQEVAKTFMLNILNKHKLMQVRK